MSKVLVFDIQGWVTLFSSYGHAVFPDCELREIEFERRAIAHEQRMRRLDARCTLAVLEFFDQPSAAARERLHAVIALIREVHEFA